MPTTLQRAIDARIKLNGNFYTTQEWMVEETSDLIDVSNTEGVPAGDGGTTELGSTAKLPDAPKVRVTITNATFDTDDNPFISPYDLAIGDFVTLQLFPGGLAENSWHFPSLAIDRVTHGGKIPGGQPISFEGESDGGYTEMTS